MMISLLLMASLYAAAVWKDKTVRRRDAFFFTGGWLALLLALSPPVHELAEAHLWAHMAQHELIMIIAAPLLASDCDTLVLSSANEFVARLGFTWNDTLGLARAVAL